MVVVDSARMDRCRERRRRLTEASGDGPIVVFGEGAGRPNPNFGYLAGIAEPRARLLLAPAGVRIGVGRANPGPDYQRGRVVHSLLFLPPSDPIARRWGEDGVATLGSVAPEQVGVDAILDVAAFPGAVESALTSATEIGIVRDSEPSFAGRESPEERWVETLRKRWFHVAVRDATPAVHEMRRAKDGFEIERMRRAVALTHEALDAALARLRPEAVEREVEAEITRRYRAAGATHGFDPIVGSGLNACLLHYSENGRAIEAGELVLVDTGAMLDGYAADITRTFPSSDGFTPRQREIYEIVLRAQEAAIERCVSGGSLADVHAAAFAVVAEAGYGDAFPHGTAHHLGIDVHDVGDRYAPLVPGCVVTVEPGIYLADEALGVRIEDDVRVTEDGPEVLSASIPKSIDEVERWVREARGRGERA